MIGTSSNNSSQIQMIGLNNGNSLPSIGLGTYALQGKECSDAVSYAIDNGYRLIDTASLYENEHDVGISVRNSGVARDKIIVQTKLYPNQYDYAPKAIDEALSKLNLKYIDIMLLHHPAANAVKAYRAIENAIKAGKIRAAGISCYYIKETDAFLPQIEIKPVLIQNEIHPYYQDTLTTKHIQSKGIAVQAWYPLGGRGYTKQMMNDDVLCKIAATHGKTVAQVILRWNTQNGVIVIPGSANKDHLRENLSIFDFNLSDDEMKLIANLDKNEKHDWY